MLYLVQPRNFGEIAANFSGIVLDSARIAANGSFAFVKTPQPETSVVLEICLQRIDGRFPTQLLDDDLSLANYMPVILQKGESLFITADADQVQATFSIQHPSAGNAALLQLRDIRQRAGLEQKQVLNKIGKLSEEVALLEEEAALQQFQRPLIAFADSSAVLWPALVAARWVSPSGDYEREPEFLFRQCEKWRAKSVDNQWVDQLCKAGSRERLPIMTGDIMPNYALPMASGDTVLLYALLGSRLTILDIWASWCAPCRRENRTVLAPVWEQYRNKGLQILGYSIESNPAIWRAAIIKDGADWPHASHLSGDTTPFLEALRITTIPANFILDAQGKILAKNLHGAALKAFVEKAMP